MLLLAAFLLLARRSKQAAHKGAEPEQGNGGEAVHYRDPARESTFTAIHPAARFPVTACQAAQALSFAELTVLNHPSGKNGATLAQSNISCSIVAKLTKLHPLSQSFKQKNAIHFKATECYQFRENSPSYVYSFRLFLRAPTHPRPPCSRVETHKRRRRRRVTARFPCSASVASARRSTSSASREWSCDGSLIGAATLFKPHPRLFGRSAEDFQTRISALVEEMSGAGRGAAVQWPTRLRAGAKTSIALDAVAMETLRPSKRATGKAFQTVVCLHTVVSYYT